jgi:hypothetical protein
MSGKSPHHRKGTAYRVTLEPSMLRKPPGTRWLLFTDLALGKRTVASENLSVAFGSLAELNDTPKAAVRAAGIGGIADVAIHQK